MKALVLYNGSSGRNIIESKIDYIVTTLKTKYEVVDTYKSEEPKSITNYLKNLTDDYSLIVICGGDGSVNEAVSGLALNDKKYKLAILPFGTCNDTARTFGMKKNLKKALKVILEDNSSQVMVHKLNDDHFFIYALATGYLTAASYTAPGRLKKKLGAIAYYLEALKKLKKLESLNANVEIDGMKLQGDWVLLLCIHTRFLAGQIIHNDYVLADSKVHFVGVRKKNKVSDIYRFVKLFLLGAKRNKYVETIYTDSVKITSQKPLAINADGEYFGELTELVVTTHKHIEIIVSKKVKKKFQ